MASNATIFKTTLQIADMDRNYYADHALTIARHPSETDERMMVRLLAFALHADEALTFCKGLSEADEPDLWQKDLTGAIRLWIEVGLPDEKRIAKACGRAGRVLVIAYGQSAGLWWKQIGEKLGRHDNLSVVGLAPEPTRALAALVTRTMRLQCSIQDGNAWLTDGERNAQVEPERWFAGASEARR
jgi:uncharacterized protein YaeQ